MIPISLAPFVFYLAILLLYCVYAICLEYMKNKGILANLYYDLQQTKDHLILSLRNLIYKISQFYDYYLNKSPKFVRLILSKITTTSWSILTNSSNLKYAALLLEWSYQDILKTDFLRVNLITKDEAIRLWRDDVHKEVLKEKLALKPWQVRPIKQNGEIVGWLTQRT